MSLIQNFTRRIEKLITSRATVPPPGTNHVDDNWLNTDSYPGELTINLSSGSLYTTDGTSIIDLNRENSILEGLVLEKDTSGVNKLTVSSGSARINGRSYFHTSSGTDISIPFNNGSQPRLYFIYGVSTTSIFGSGASGNYTLGLTSTFIAGGATEPGGLFSAVAATSGVPTPPADSLLLGTVLVNVGSTGYDLWPRSVSNLGDYFPKISSTPSEFLRDSVGQIKTYEYHQLYFPGEFVIDSISNTTYLVKNTFVSDNSSISADISAGNIVILSGGGTGGTGSYSATSLGTGSQVYKATVGTQFQFRSLTSSGPVTLTQGADEITIGLSTSGFVSGATNIGSGATVFAGLSSTIAQFRSLTAGSNVSIVASGDEIVISVPSIGSTAQGINLGAGASGDIYAGMSGNDLTFRRVAGSTGVSVVQAGNTIVLSTSAKNNQGTNFGGGPGSVYGGMSGDNLIFNSITGGGIVTISQVGNLITVSATASGGGSASGGLNIGSLGGEIYAGMSGTDLTFKSVVAGAGILVSQVGNDLQIDNISLGTQGFQGPSGADGVNGVQGPQGFDGPQGDFGPTGASGIDGVTGPQGFLGPQGAQGNFGPQGPASPIGDQRFIDIFDSLGGTSVSSGAWRYMPFNSVRSNVDPVLFTTGGATVGTSLTGNFVQINEDGNYLFIYSITLGTTSPVGEATAALFNYTTQSLVSGSSVYFKNSGPETITATGKVGLTGLTAGTRFVIRVDVSASPVSTWFTQEAASSLYVSKQEITAGQTGSTGPIGVQGPQGPSLFTSPPGSTSSPGVTGNYSASNGIFYFHDGSQWWSLTGSSF